MSSPPNMTMTKGGCSQPQRWLAQGINGPYPPACKPIINETAMRALATPATLSHSAELVSATLVVPRRVAIVVNGAVTAPPYRRLPFGSNCVSTTHARMD